VVEMTGVSGTKVTTPCVKQSSEEAQSEDVPLELERAKTYRSAAMRAAYLSQDRPDLQYAVRELAKGMKEPTERHWTALKRLARFLKLRPRLVQRFPVQGAVRELECWADADHAGCIRTRKSTSGGVIMFGSSCIKTYSKGQAVISLSSGESEYYGLVSGMASLLGEVAVARDWGLSLSARVWMDASAGIAIGSRRGLGRVKHIDTVFLWCQQMVTSGRVKVGKQSTHDMLADVLTKPVPEALMTEMLRRMGFEYVTGRHALGKAL
jgi:hypothetical protein